MCIRIYDTKIIYHTLKIVMVFLFLSLSNGFAEDSEVIKNFLVAAKDGNLSEIKRIVSNGIDVNIQDKSFGNTPLMLASWAGQTEAVKLLIDKGADVNVRQNYGETALTMASSTGHLEIVRILLNNGAEVNAKNKDGGTALLAASASGHSKVVKLLLSKKPDINAQTSTAGLTALIAASQNGHLKVVNLLLDHGANPKIKDNKDRTALGSATERGHKEIQKTFWNNGIKE